MKELKIQAGKDSFKADLADNFLSRAKGLSFRSEGKMLFVFSKPSQAKIDMMFLSKPLYLYFMDSEKEVIEVQEAEPWSWNPSTWRLYAPDQKYSYLLESFEQIGIEEGDRLQFEI